VSHNLPAANVIKSFVTVKNFKAVYSVTQVTYCKDMDKETFSFWMFLKLLTVVIVVFYDKYGK